MHRSEDKKAAVRGSAAEAGEGAGATFTQLPGQPDGTGPTAPVPAGEPALKLTSGQPGLAPANEGVAGEDAEGFSDARSMQAPAITHVHLNNA